MAAPKPQRKPTFLWQAILILLPVIVLAVVGWVSLQVEESASEQEALKRARENVAAFARALGGTLTEELTRYVQLQNQYASNLRTVTSPGSSIITDNAELETQLKNWDRDHAANMGGSITDWLVPEGSVLTNGVLHSPPGTQAVPRPPRWYLELSPEQRSLWEKLCEAKARNSSTNGVDEAERKFADSGASPDARLAVENLKNPLGHQAPLRDSELSESGVAFRDIECLKLLRDDKVSPNEAVLASVWRGLFESPTIFASTLVDAAEVAAPRMAPSERARWHQMRRLWLMETRSRRWMEALREKPVVRTWEEPPQFRACWLVDSDDSALTLLNPARFGPDERSLTHGYICTLIPGDVLAAMMQHAVEVNDFLIPAYARAAVSVEGTGVFGKVTPSEDETLAASTQQFGTRMMAEVAGFDVQFILTDRDLMLASQRRRSGLFLCLLLAAVGVAFLGVVWAHKAFRREQLLNDQKSNFVSSVSHELRAPIASVRLMAESLERGNVTEPEKQREYFHFIGQECRRLSALIANVLDFSRIEQGRKQYEFEPTDLHALVETTVKLMEPYAEERGVKLETLNLEPRTLNLELVVDGRAIQQALVNLIDNAIKHSAAGQTVTVALEASENGTRYPQHAAAAPINPQPSTLNLSVSDHGPGIPASEREKIFERFYRLGSELRRETQGVGIGLSIVKHIVEAHGGRVLVESAPGQGSRFVIELPGNPNR